MTTFSIHNATDLEIADILDGDGTRITIHRGDLEPIAINCTRALPGPYFARLRNNHSDFIATSLRMYEHSAAVLTVSKHYPDNANSFQINIGEMHVHIFGMPTKITDVLFPKEAA